MLDSNDSAMRLAKPLKMSTVQVSKGVINQQLIGDAYPSCLLCAYTAVSLLSCYNHGCMHLVSLACIMALSALHVVLHC